MHRHYFFRVRPSLLILLYTLGYFLQCRVVQAQPPVVTLQQAFPRLTFSQPIFLTEAPDNSGRLFVAQQNGIIRVFPRSSDPAPAQVSTFLDISGKVLNSG